jgi:hypothetical protein
MFLKTDIKHVWRHEQSGLYAFSDEAEQIHPGVYWCQEDAHNALLQYSDHLNRDILYKTFHIP